MPKRDKRIKPLPREHVIPFAGEENFVVPKRGGFGQPDMEDFVMVVGGTRQSTLDAPEISTGTTTSDAPLPTSQTASTLPLSTGVGSGGGTTTLNPQLGQYPTSTGTTTSSPSGEITPTTQPQAPATTITQPSLIPETTTTTTTPPFTMGNTGLGSTETTTTTTTGGTRTPLNVPLDTSGVISTPPTFPNWESLSCPALQTEIGRFEAMLANSTFTSSVASLISSQITTAKTLYNTKCPVSPPVTPPLFPPAVLIPTAPIFGGGGGGLGLGEEDVIQVEETPKTTNKTIWIALAILLGVYLLTRKD